MIERETETKTRFSSHMMGSFILHAESEDRDARTIEHTERKDEKRENKRGTER